MFCPFESKALYINIREFTCEGEVWDMFCESRGVFQKQLGARKFGNF